MLIHKNDIQTIAHFAANNDVRTTLNGIQVETDGTLVATDGHVLGILKPRQGKEEEFPALKGLPNLETTEPLKPCVLSKSALLSVAKQLKAPKQFPILNFAQIDTVEANKNGHVPMRITDLENQNVASVVKIEGTFPDYKRVVPDEDSLGYRICFDAAILMQALQAAVQHCGKDRAIVEFEFPTNGLGGTSAVVANSECQTLQMVIMPCKGKRTMGVLPPKKKKESKKS